MNDELWLTDLMLEALGALLLCGLAFWVFRWFMKKYTDDNKKAIEKLARAEEYKEEKSHVIKAKKLKSILERARKKTRENDPP